MANRRTLAIVVAVVAIAAGAWYFLAPEDEGAAVRKRLQAFAAEVNASTTDGAGAAARAYQLASYFTEDVEVDLGQGAPPIHGRDTIMGMAVRLQPRTAAFRLEFEDISVALAPGGNAADVHLTAEFIRRSITTGEQSFDAREFAIGMRRVDEEWRIATVTAVETLTR